MTKTRANGYSSESTQCELSNEYQHDRVYMVFKNLCILVFWTNVSSALKGLNVAENVTIIKISSSLNITSIFYNIHSFSIFYIFLFRVTTLHHRRLVYIKDHCTNK